MFLLRLVLVLFLFVSVAYAYEQVDYTPYIFKKGETLTDVLARKNLKPLYGKNNWVQKTLRLNRLNEDTTKTLKAGDVLLLPISKKYFAPEEIAANYVHRDSIKTNSSARMKGTIHQRSQRHLVSAGIEYVYTTVDLGASGGEAVINQGTGAKISYRYRDITPQTDWKLNVGGSARILGQSDVEFSKQERMGATFTPSYRIDGFVEGFYWPRYFQAQLKGEYDYYSYLNYSNNRYRVNKGSTFRVGPRLAFDFEGGKIGYDVYGEMLVGISTKNAKGNTTVSPDRDWRYRVGTGALIYQKVHFGLYYEGLDYMARGQRQEAYAGTLSYFF